MVVMLFGNLFAQNPIYNPTRVYDTVTDADEFYFFSMPKPCIDPNISLHAPLAGIGQVLLQEYVSTDTLTVYGVAVTFANGINMDYIYDDAPIRALLMTPLGPSPVPYYYSMQPVDSVSLSRAQTRYCWFLYEDDCNEKLSRAVPCYEFYFDTPKQINSVTDTFYVGYGWTVGQVLLIPYGGSYDNSMPGHLYRGVIDGIHDPNDLFSPFIGYGTKVWGIAFPITGFRCGPISRYWLDAYTGDSAMVRWRSVEEGTLYNVRLVGEDGSDTTYITSDTTLAFSHLSDSIRYNVMLRKQCHYATSNYDTTVYSDWLSYISFGHGAIDTTLNPNDTTHVGLHQTDMLRLYTSVSPNPATGKARVTSSFGLTQIDVYDTRGRLLHSLPATGLKADLDVSSWPRGTYLLRIQTPAGPTTKKLLVQ